MRSLDVRLPERTFAHRDPSFDEPVQRRPGRYDGMLFLSAGRASTVLAIARGSSNRRRPAMRCAEGFDRSMQAVPGKTCVASIPIMLIRFLCWISRHWAVGLAGRIRRCRIPRRMSPITLAASHAGCI